MGWLDSTDCLVLEGLFEEGYGLDGAAAHQLSGLGTGLPGFFRLVARGVVFHLGDELDLFLGGGGEVRDLFLANLVADDRPLVVELDKAARTRQDHTCGYGVAPVVLPLISLCHTGRELVV